MLSLSGTHHSIKDARSLQQTHLLNGVTHCLLSPLLTYLWILWSHIWLYPFPHHWFCQASLNIFNLCPFSWLHIFLHFLKCLFLLLYLLFSLLLLVRNISQYLRDLALYCLYLAGKENLKTSRPRDEVAQSRTRLSDLAVAVVVDLAHVSRELAKCTRHNVTFHWIYWRALFYFG